MVGVHMWDMSGFGFFVGLKHFSNWAVSDKISWLKQISGFSAPESQSTFSCWFSSSSKSCFLSLWNLCPFFKKSTFLLGVNLEEFAVLLCSCDKAVQFSRDKAVNISSPCV